jgi:hypothetical protein
MTIMETSTGTFSISLESKVKPADLAKALAAAVSVTDKHGVINTSSVYLEWNNEGDIRVTGTDSYCLYSAGTTDVALHLSDSVLIKHNDATAISKLLKVKTCHSATFTVTDLTLIVSTADGSLNVPLLTSKYPDYRKLIVATDQNVWPADDENPVVDPAIMMKLMNAINTVTPNNIAGRVKFNNLHNRRSIMLSTVGTATEPWQVVCLIMPVRT